MAERGKIESNHQPRYNTFPYMLWKYPIHPSILFRTLRTYSTDHVINPLLLKRADRLLAQYTQLSKEAASDTSFTDETAARQKRLSQLASFHEIYTEWKTAQDNLTSLNDLINTTTDAELKSLAEEDITSSEESLRSLSSQLEGALLPQHPQSHLPALMEIRPGIGGDEANIFANDLLKMYEKYAASRKWKVTTYSTTQSELGDGITECILSISNAFGDLRGEAGVHRVQRTPSTDSKGRIHTSTVSINVLPDIQDESISEIDMKDIKLEVMRSRGAGGQHVNRTESAVRLTHLPTGLTISMQDSRSQHANKRAAFAILGSKLDALRREKEEEVQKGLRRTQVSSTDRSEKIRTFNFAQNRVTDHRSGYSSHDLEGILEGREGLHDLINATKTYISMNELENLE